MLGGIRDVLIISTPQHTPLMQELLKDGSHLGMHFEYCVQEHPNGLAEAFILGKNFVGLDNVTLILGDNLIWGHDLSTLFKESIQRVEREDNAVVFAYQVSHPENYGVIEFDENSRACSLEEKPPHPRSSYAVPGIYVYPSDVVEKAANLLPSARGELEITDLNRLYLEEGKLHVSRLERGFAWFDMGTHDDLLEASNFIASLERRTQQKIACPEEIAFQNGWISRQQLEDYTSTFGGSAYAKYLHKVLKRHTP
ncbi:unnamed protein product [Darwinula stevensoni]|uniref:glucose-1-phosphate thymidylyltransferase n=1 Tax=Darwinula stevensoni TaxID=69355 RepID=A0A7R8X992_9CRUS|nr:unnamed protein product [Darwinula stevensoni]CAG0888942.1 unnamed protein product [Darwinula stevensoni]